MKNMKQALLVAGCLLATTTLFAQTEKGDWAQFGRYAKANKTVKVPSNVVFMGNSITDGWWPADSTFFIRNNFVDRGISGQTTSEMLVRFRQDVINLKPKAVVILAGINDIAHNNGVIALAGNEFAGFSYIESWGNKQYVTTSGLIVHPNFRGLGIAKRIKDMTFQLARMRWPKAKIFSLTSGAAVMKMNTELGYVPVTFSDLTDDEAFWRGCNGCVNHDILERTERKYCICTAMLFDPADPHRAQREREARNQTKKD